MKIALNLWIRQVYETGRHVQLRCSVIIEHPTLVEDYAIFLISVSILAHFQLIVQAPYTIQSISSNSQFHAKNNNTKKEQKNVFFLSKLRL